MESIDEVVDVDALAAASAKQAAREEAESHAKAVRGWLAREITLGHLSWVERAVIERLADDLEARR